MGGVEEAAHPPLLAARESGNGSNLADYLVPATQSGKGSRMLPGLQEDLDRHIETKGQAIRGEDA